MNHILHFETILYVADQELSCKFYQNLLRCKPTLHVKGMTEFQLFGNCTLGLMPNAGIAKILTEKVPHPDKGINIPRCELYLRVNDVQFEYDHAVKSGAKLISAIADRNWGDKVCYFADLDGHIIAFAEKLN